MIEIAEYQWEQIAAFVGNFGFVLIGDGYELTVCYEMEV